MDLTNITATILAKNAKKHLADVLRALHDFGEIIVLDNGSTDETCDIARAFQNVTVYPLEEFNGFGMAHRRMEELAAHDWILSIDADEVLGDDAKQAIKATKLDEHIVYEFTFKNYFNGKWITTCGWHPDAHPRLYHKKYARFTENAVHEKVEGIGTTIQRMNGHIAHYSYDSIEDFLRKMQHYSTLFAAQHVRRKNASPLTALAHGFFSFFKSYILKRGFTQGYEGFVISVYNAQTAFWKYLKLYEANNR